MDQKLMSLSLEEKTSKSKNVILEAVERFGEDKVAVAWTSGKDSTVLLHLIKEAFQGGVPIPIIFVDTGKHFSEVYRFRDLMAEKWGFKVINAKNTIVTDAIKEEVVRVQDLPDEMMKELLQIGWTEEDFRIGLDREPCCHLLKTVATKQALKEHKLEALMAGIRWDEQESRSNETYFSPREQPRHVRVHPILHFRWKDIWEYLEKYNVPYNPLYDKGYTSIGCFTCTSPNPEGKIERGGRSQDKEETMKRLRALGYF